MTMACAVCVRTMQEGDSPDAAVSAAQVSVWHASEVLHANVSSDVELVFAVVISVCVDSQHAIE
jgi:hypothetical protein